MAKPEILDNHKLFQLACKLQGKWGLLLGFHWEEEEGWLDEMVKACPFLDLQTDYQAVGDGQGVLFFDTREEMEHYFDLVVGDDGPTKLNPYDGPAKVYALTCSPIGQLWNENT